MEQIILLAFTITFIYCGIKFIEMKYVDHEMKPLKHLVRDAFIVFLSAFVGGYVSIYMNGTISDFFNIVTENKTMDMASTQIFTDVPGF